jgi:subtilisin family serine protease
VRVLDDDGNGPVFIVAKGIRYAVDAGARVINASLGTDADSGILQDAIHYAYDHQVIITTSAGNDNSRQDQFPAKYSDTLAVSATDIDDSKASFSNFNSYITVSAPGVSVYSTYLHSSMAWWDGTSQAAPFVAGEAALILALHPSWDRSDVRNCIRNSVVDIDPINPNYQGQLGDGRIDLARITSCR